MQNRIRHWRRERGLSQEALGRLVGLAKPTISKLERGELRLRDVTISRLVEALGVSANELLGDYAAGAGGSAAEPPPDHGEAAETTHFGFGTVDVAEKARLVGGVFASVARNYDVMNDLMSGGVHRLWKSDMIAALRPRPGIRLLDLAGGTGDIARRVMARIATVQAGDAKAGGRIVVCDASEAMLGVGRDRALDDGIVAGIDWLCGDAENLPLADASMDACTIAFGIRNVTRVERALGEVRRVLKPGGRFLCLEFSHVRAPALAALYDAYSFRVLPTLGAVVAGDRDSYRYLVESIRRFPDQESFAAMIADAGLGQVSYRNLTGGIAALHSAWRI